MPPKAASKTSSSAAAPGSKPVKSAASKAKGVGSTNGAASDGGGSGSGKASGSKSATTTAKKATSSSKPSTSGSSKPLANVKMTAFEQLIHKHVLSLPKKTMVQSEVKEVQGLPDDPEKVASILNGMLRKQLLRLIKTPRGESGFVANSLQEAKELGSMDTSEKMCLEYISSTTNQGMWTRTLKAKTNLHQNVITRALKVLEQRKLIKNVKSVKFPTRKIYMLASTIPSIDVTGGPWYTAKGELDMEFIEALERTCKNFIKSKSFPQGDTNLMWPRGYVPYLPTANDLLEFLTAKDVLRDVQLDVEHIEVILNVLVYDGEIERIWCRRYDADGRHFEMDTTPTEEELKNNSKKRKKKGGANGKSKRARRDSADIDKDSDENDDDDEDEEEDEDPQSSEADDDFELPPRPGGGGGKGGFTMNGDGEDEKPHQRPGPAGNQWYWVYRTLLTAIPSSSTKNEEGKTVHTYPEIYEVGLTQTPCGICPVAQFCYNRGQPKVLPLPGEKDLADSGSTGWEEWKTSSSVSQRAKKSGKDAADPKDRMKALLKMKVPAGGGEFEDADGKWKGGGKVGGKVIAPVNPSNCRYYSQWFGEELEW